MAVKGEVVVKTVLSDVDGTLFRTLEMVRLAQWETVSIIIRRFRGAAHLVPGTLDRFMEALSPFFGMGPKTELIGAIGTLTSSMPELVLNVDPDEALQLLHQVEARLAPHHLTGFDGLPKFLRGLGERGQTLGLVTSGVIEFVYQSFACVMPEEMGLAGLHLDSFLTREERTDRLVQSVKSFFGIPDFTIVSREDVDEPKPHPQIVEVALSRLCGEPETTAYVGDHKTDMKVARRTGLRLIIGVAHRPDPLCSQRALRRAGATHTARNLHRVTYLLAA